MSNKPIATIEVISTLLGMIKTGFIVTTMILLEFAKMEKAKAKLGESLAQNDLKIEKAKEGYEKAVGNKSDDAVIDEFLASKMLHGSGDVTHRDGN